jgi:nitrous-oxide reductase
VLKGGAIGGKDITWGDTHHPAISETNGAYDGQFLFINDKSNPRLAVIDLRDFETKQIVVNPIFKNEHGGAFVTPNSEYIIEAAQYAAPLENGYVPLDQFNDKYRGGLTYWKFDRTKGRIVPEDSFSFELPPYSQDLSDSGKGPSDGWGFTNSFCTERYVGGIELGRPPFEAGCSAKDTDFLHVTNWKKAAELVKAGKAKKINGHNVIPIDVAVKEGILFLIPEPKSPHGCDVTPDGKFIIVSGKLDTHTMVYSFAKIQEAIKAKKFEGKDAYGIPIIAMKDALHKQVELGLGPLHTQYDSKACIGYTSLYVDSQVAKWDYCEGKVLDKLSVHYNIGHLMTMEGDSRQPEGPLPRRAQQAGHRPLQPGRAAAPAEPPAHRHQRRQDAAALRHAVPLGEPHYAVAISAGTLKPGALQGRHQQPHRREAPGRRARRRREDRAYAGKVEVFGTLIRSHITPEIIEVEKGDEVTINLTNLERAEDETHGFTISAMNVHASVEPGKTVSVKFKADREGVFPYYCTEFCSALHLEMQGYFLVKPKGYKATAVAAAKAEYTKADYDKQYNTCVETQKVIDSVVGWIVSTNFKDFPDAVALVEDATDQLKAAEEPKKKMERLRRRKTGRTRRCGLASGGSTR